MMQKVIGIGVVVLLVGALVGGGAYLLLRDSGSSGNGSAGGGRSGQNQAAAIESGAGGGRGNSGTEDLASGGYRGGRGNDGTVADLAIVERGGRGSSGTEELAGGGYGGGKATTGNGAGTSEATVAPEDWLTVSGVVVEMEEELVVRTADGEEFTFGLGPSHYRESSGVTIAVGDEVQVTGFYEDGELKAGTVENLSSGQVLALRDESGRPLWSGRGRGGQ